MRKRKSYVGIVDQGKSVGFKKVIDGKQSVDSSLVSIRVQIFCIRTRLMVYADEKKGGYKIGDFIRRDTRGKLWRYKGNEGYSTLIFKKKEVCYGN